MDPDRLRADLLRGNRFCHGTIVARRELLEALGGYRVEFAYAQDYDLCLRASERSELRILPGAHYRWRLRAGGISAGKKIPQLVYSVLARTFAMERRLYGNDSCASLALDGKDDFEGMGAFFKGHRMGRRFAWWACKALAGRKGGPEMLGRLGIHPVFAYFAAVPKAGVAVWRGLECRLGAGR
jgi:hypothetical protein